MAICATTVSTTTSVSTTTTLTTIRTKAKGMKVNISGNSEGKLNQNPLGACRLSKGHV